MSTVDWSRWPEASPREREELLGRYREIVKAESEEARLSNYARMNTALANGGPGWQTK